MLSDVLARLDAEEVHCHFFYALSSALLSRYHGARHWLSLSSQALQLLQNQPPLRSALCSNYGNSC